MNIMIGPTVYFLCQFVICYELQKSKNRFARMRQLPIHPDAEPNLELSYKYFLGAAPRRRLYIT